MDITALLGWLETTPLAEYLQQSSWAFQALETIHILGFSLVVGTISIMDLRLLDLAWRDRPVTDVADDCLVWTWLAFFVAVIAGVLMFMTKANVYFNNTQFQIKMLLILAAGINVLVFHRGVYRRVEDWNSDCPVPFAAKLAGAISLALWIAVIVFGRWIGFSLDQSPPML